MLIERYVNIDYECLLHLARIGRLQKRTTLTTATIPLKTIVQQLLDAIRLCYLSTNDSEFIQTCYFELILVLLEYGRTSIEVGRKLSIKSLPVTKPNELSTTTDQPIKLKQRQVNSSRAAVSVSTRRQQQQQVKQAAAIAIRTATQMAINQKQR